ncbi:MAG: uroporphyrinogen decarboxylase family protein [Anaerolineae bacterium]
MSQPSCKQRLIKILNGEESDRIPTFDVLHNIELIEHLAEDKVTPSNAEDLLCIAAGKTLDLIRHFAPPDRLQPRLVSDSSGFVYKYDWWTAHCVERPPMKSSKDVEYYVKRDIETIYRHIEAGKVCPVARQHVRLFDENYETFEEVKLEFRRIIEKLNGTMMLPPEDVSALGVAVERYDETGWWYLWYDYPDTARAYMDALADYQIAFIDAFADADLVPFTQISNPIGTRTGLLYSPEFIKSEVIPREQKKVDRWKQHGYYVFSFMDGYKLPVIEEFLNMGVCEIHPIEPFCGIDVSTFRHTYPEITVGQPIDCLNFLPLADEQQIREAVITAIEDAGKKRIIIGSTSVIHSGIPIKNAVAMFETARSYAL